MLEQVDLTKALNGDEYDQRMDALKLKMYDLGHAVYVSKTPVIIVFEGWSCAGKGSAISELTSRLDPRGFRVYPIGPPNCVEQEFPWLYRFWLKIPGYGEMSIFDTSWYRRVTVDRVSKEIAKPEWKQAYQDIQEFERELADDGVVIIKLFMHISESEQARRIKRLLAKKKTAWRVGDLERLEQKRYDRFVKAYEEMFGRTEAEYAPWTIIPATDRHWTNVQVFETIISRLEPRVAPSEAPLPAPIQRQLRTIEQQDRIDLTAEPPPPPPADESKKGEEPHA